MNYLASDKEITDAVLGAFLPMTAIPRPSGHTERISEYLYKFAVSHGFKAERDKVGNVIFDSPATPGMENKPMVSLQAHMDMVFATNPDSGLDPLTTPVNAVLDGDFIRTDGTTSLGGDDAIGIAMALCIAENKMPHGPVRVIITVDEETDFTGVKNINPRHLDGVDYMINIDSEDEGYVTVSTASGTQHLFDKTFPVTAASGIAYSLKVSGLSGGHSGVCIGERLNAIKAVFRILNTLADNQIAFSLVSLKGGMASNAIPDMAEAVIVIGAGKAKEVEAIAFTAANELKSAHENSDPAFTFDCCQTALPSSVVSVADSALLSAFGNELFDGVNTWSSDIPTLVESSSNFGIVSLKDGVFHAHVMSRSSSPEKEAELNQMHRKIGEKFGITLMQEKNCDAWPYNPKSRLLDITKRVYRERFGKEIVVEAIHAGLECGTFALYKPALEMISIGPTAAEAHSVKEYCDLRTVPMVWHLIEDILANI